MYKAGDKILAATDYERVGFLQEYTVVSEDRDMFLREPVLQ